MTRIGVDTGGTFTDLVLLGPDGMAVHKVRSTPDDPSRAILAGIGDMPGGEDAGDVVHGSTVATNAVLERKGARVALLVTAGFEDVLRIGRQTRPELYNLMVRERRPLVDAALTFGIPERVAADGSVLVPLDIEAVRRVSAGLADAGVRAIAVCFLHSYRNPAHERQTAGILRENGFIVSESHQVLREYREFERWSTTVVNAYVTPLMSQYLSALDASLERARLSIMQSNGGSIAAATARREAVRTILSGPAAGVVGRACGRRDGGLPAADHVRHGRHVDGRQPRRRRDRHDQRVVRRRLPGTAAGHRYPHRGRGRRVDRLRRFRRRAPRRSPERRRRSRAGLLRPRDAS